MNVPKIIEKELAKRGWEMQDEKWRTIRGKDWACAYFTYRSKCCLITVDKLMFSYLITILYKFPVCSQYRLTGNKFDVDLKQKL